jgi:tRNA G37 N-methylase TrmD
VIHTVQERIYSHVPSKVGKGKHAEIECWQLHVKGITNAVRANLLDHLQCNTFTITEVSVAEDAVQRT